MEAAFRRVLGPALVGAALVLACQPAAMAAAVSPAPPPASQPSSAPALCGRLEKVDGVDVLTLWGSPYDRGYAHGNLMAQGVLDIVDAVCGTNLLLSHRSDYQKVILPLMDRFSFDDDDLAEMRGMLDGLHARLGSQAALRRIGRPITLEDLKAFNTAGDWYRQACSSFAAWGSRAKDGHVWVGRNFDFLPAREFFKYQMLIVHHARGGRKAWATVATPGMVGCVTGLNAEGVFVSVHDVFLAKLPVEGQYSPRLSVLRRLMEQCGLRDLAAQALPILEARHQMFDNAILLAAPVKDGTPPAVVFEYNGDLSKDKGVTVRRSEDNEPKLAAELLTCTNDFRKRAKPSWKSLDYRHSLMRQVLMAKTRRGQLVDFDIARKTMGSVRLPITVHTVIVDLNTQQYWFAAGEYLSPPGNRDFKSLPMAEWLTAAQKETPAAAKAP